MDYAKLKKLLKNRLDIISDSDLRENEPEKQLKMLGEVSAKIDSWKEAHRETIDKRMLHFLDNYSLEKAYAFADDHLTRCKQ